MKTLVDFLGWQKIAELEKALKKWHRNSEYVRSRLTNGLTGGNIRNRVSPGFSSASCHKPFATEDRTMPKRPQEPIPDGDVRPESPDSSDGIGGTEVPREGGRTVPHERRDSLGNAFADIIRSLTKQWFGAPAPDLNFTKRFLCAGAGSVTFFLVGFYNSLLPETLQLIIDPLYILSNIVAYFLFTMISMWFAWLVSWQDMQYGPIRLYLSGFLLPYFVWFLAVKLPVFEQ